MTTKIDKWAAEQCGVKLWNDGAIISGPLSGRWTIKDPRCREIVREHFKICTVKHTSTKPNRNWQSNSFLNVGFIAEFGSTLEEAEIACITAIYEAEE